MHTLDPMVTRVLFGPLANPLPLMVNRTPPYVLPAAGATLEIDGFEVSCGDETTLPTPAKKCIRIHAVQVGAIGLPSMEAMIE